MKFFHWSREGGSALSAICHSKLVCCRQVTYELLQKSNFYWDFFTGTMWTLWNQVWENTPHVQFGECLQFEFFKLKEPCHLFWWCCTIPVDNVLQSSKQELLEPLMQNNSLNKSGRGNPLPWEFVITGTNTSCLCYCSIEEMFPFCHDWVLEGVWQTLEGDKAGWLTRQLWRTCCFSYF